MSNFIFFDLTYGLTTDDAVRVYKDTHRNPPLITLRPGGVELKPDLAPEQAAARFWDAVVEHYRDRRTVPTLWNNKPQRLVLFFDADKKPLLEVPAPDAFGATEGFTLFIREDIDWVPPAQAFWAAVYHDQRCAPHQQAVFHFAVTPDDSALDVVLRHDFGVEDAAKIITERVIKDSVRIQQTQPEDRCRLGREGIILLTEQQAPVSKKYVRSFGAIHDDRGRISITTGDLPWTPRGEQFVQSVREMLAAHNAALVAP